MASRTFFDATGRGRWRITYHDGRKWRKATLGPHPTPWDRSRPPVRPPGGIERAAAKYRGIEAAARAGDVAPEPGPSRTDLLPFLEAYQASYALGHARNSAKVLATALGHFRRFCHAASIARLDRVGEADCRAYLEARLLAGAARSTVVTERSFLVPLFRRAADDGLLAASPWDRVRVPGKRRLEEAGYWTREELDRLVAAAGDDWCRDFIRVAANTGLRCGSLTHLQWADVDFIRGVVVVRAALEANKGGRRYEVPLTAVARDVLAARRARRPDDTLVFPGERSGRPVGNHEVSVRLHRVVLRAGLPERGRYAHALRHTFASHAVLAGVPLAVVSRWLGHASVAMTGRYAHLCPDASAAFAGTFSLGAGPSSPPARPESRTG
jgi:integrase